MKNESDSLFHNCNSIFLLSLIYTVAQRSFCIKTGSANPKILKSWNPCFQN